MTEAGIERIHDIIVYAIEKFKKFIMALNIFFILSFTNGLILFKLLCISFNYIDVDYILTPTAKEKINPN
jgi:hypothetical protein